MVLVGFGANKHDPVGSIAGSRSWLQPLAIATNSNNAVAHSRITGSECVLVGTAEGATKRMEIKQRQGIPQNHGNVRRCETRVRIGQGLSVEPYHAACADDAKRQHLLLPKRNIRAAFLTNVRLVAFVFGDYFTQSANTDPTGIGIFTSQRQPISPSLGESKLVAVSLGLQRFHCLSHAFFGMLGGD